jgi:galactose mutarotase-like enzyme
MEHKISSPHLTVTVRELGAELMSIKDRDGTEYLWQGDPAIWEDRAPIMFPICGRLNEQRYFHNGKEYNMGLHGLLWKCDLTLTEKTDTSAVLTLTDNEETRAAYPFSFEVNVSYTLVDNSVKVGFCVKNTGNETMYFSHGYHPGFNLPYEEDGKFSDCYVEFAKKCAPKLVDMSNTTYLLTGKYPEYPVTDGNIIPLSNEMFDLSSTFLKDTARELTVRDKNSEHYVSVSFPECEYLGFWQAAGVQAKYVCVEPWNGLPDMDGVSGEFKDKIAMKALEPDAVYTNEIVITLN